MNNRHRPLPPAAEPSRYPDLDTAVPNVARVYDVLLGGKDNFAADRRAAEQLLAAVPSAAVAARENRAFLARAVRFLAREAGICQFLDVGTGLPTGGSVHEIAQAEDPRRVRVVYTDCDSMVVRHAEAMLGHSLTVAVANADLRQPRWLLTNPTVQSLINLAEPVAVLLVAVLHFLEDREDPWTTVNCIKDLVAPGSYIVISHVTDDHISAEAARRARQIYQGASAPGVARTYGQIAKFFGGLEMVSPGLVKVSDWRPDHIGPSSRPTLFYAGVGQKVGGGRPR